MPKFITEGAKDYITLVLQGKGRQGLHHFSLATNFAGAITDKK